MKRGVLFVVGLSLVATGAFAQNQAAIDKALMAAPNRAKEGAGVIGWDADKFMLDHCVVCNRKVLHGNFGLDHPDRGRF